MTDRPDPAAPRLAFVADEDLSRTGEPVRGGVPWPPGALHDPSRLVLRDARDDARLPLQTRILERWTDGSIRWLLIDTLAGPHEGTLELLPADASADAAANPLRVHEPGTGEVIVETGVRRFRLRAGGPFPFAGVEDAAGRPTMDPTRAALVVEPTHGAPLHAVFDQIEVEEAGPVRAIVRLRGTVAEPGAEPFLTTTARIHLFAGSPVARIDVTLRNPRPAQHPGGRWELGDPGSVLIRDASLTLALPPDDAPGTTRVRVEPDEPLARTATPLEIYQDSSGGEHWRSRVHLDRDRRIPCSFRGYRVRAGTKPERRGHRASPIVLLQRGDAFLGVTLQHFWQTFPKAIETDDDTVTVRLFPGQASSPHELQGGEQKTHVVFVAFGEDPITDVPLAWCHDPLAVELQPGWYAAAETAPWLLPRDEDPDEADAHRQLAEAAIDGEDTFESKRERVDEYGWRHFGELWADHEAVRHDGPEAFVTHYNNQYDALYGLLVQHLRSGDRRWKRLADELAAHVVDVDVYHTDGDKAAYNHGLFWHTYHYTDADIATHRSYPTRGDDVPGGGPSNEHCYTSGLLLHHLLTGDPLSRETVLELADWMIAMDDGTRSVFRVLAGGATGLASQTYTRDHHGPGRGAGNAIVAMIDAHRLTGEARYLAKAEELIRRCIHPEDDLAARRLDHVESRWSYTIFLQALGRYLDHKAERDELDERYAYARASLLHYGRWIAEREHPYLERPELLEFPTETWAAQDLHKSDALAYAALHAEGSERARFRERASFFLRDATTRLADLPTRTLTRPVVLLLSHGLAEPWLVRHPDAARPAPRTTEPFPPPLAFEPKRARAIRRACILAALAAALAVGTLVLLVSRATAG